MGFGQMAVATSQEFKIFHHLTPIFTRDHCFVLQVATTYTCCFNELTGTSTWGREKAGENERDFTEDRDVRGAGTLELSTPAGADSTQ